VIVRAVTALVEEEALSLADGPAPVASGSARRPALDA
jgi:hypothetical protein